MVKIYNLQLELPLIYNLPPHVLNDFKLHITEIEAFSIKNLIYKSTIILSFRYTFTTIFCEIFNQQYTHFLAN
jgi:hypothetical protein